MDRIGVIFGGKSGEHDISIMSANSVANALDKTNHQLVLIGVDRDGGWHLLDEGVTTISRNQWIEHSQDIEPSEIKEYADFIFPVIHGTRGEDGVLQGFLELIDIPYAGSGVLASSLCMDKAMAKEVCARNGIHTCKHKIVQAVDLDHDIVNIVKEISREFAGPLFVKPANAGSSLGVSKVDDIVDIGKALALAGSFDRRILVEEAIIGREIEVGVIGNEKPEVSYPGEITTGAAFDYYDFAAKYSDSSGTRLDIPADLPENVTEKIRQIALDAYRATDCAGFARVDFFLEAGSGDILLNEINTIPGLTKYSLFPLMWEETGIGFTELIERIIGFGYERYNNKNSRQTLRRR